MRSDAPTAMLCRSAMPCQVAARLALLESRLSYPEVVVVGGGYAGVELAAAVADRLQGRARIKLVTSTPDILNGSPEASTGGMPCVQGVVGVTGAAAAVGCLGAEVKHSGAAWMQPELKHQPRRWGDDPHTHPASPGPHPPPQPLPVCRATAKRRGACCRTRGFPSWRGPRSQRCEWQAAAAAMGPQARLMTWPSGWCTCGTARGSRR